MAYAQWVIILITNVGTKPFMLKNLQLEWGKLYADGDKDHEVSTDDYNNKVLEAGDILQLNACGRSDASSGTTGSFDLVDPNSSNKLVRSFYWDCPWGSKTNVWTVSGANTKWMVEYRGQNLNSGALGTISVDVFGKN